jgi:hypothetical protein
MATIGSPPGRVSIRGMDTTLPVAAPVPSIAVGIGYAVGRRLCVGRVIGCHFGDCRFRVAFSYLTTLGVLPKTVKAIAVGTARRSGARVS